MESVVMPGVIWYRDRNSLERGEPGIRHSYLACLATVLNHIDTDFDPVRLVGASGFAFRMWISPTFCPSAMSVFDWDDLLPDAVEQYGYHCQHISCYRSEGHGHSQQCDIAHQAIVSSLDRGIPVVCWDVADTEWGVLTGYSEDERVYSAVDHRGAECPLPFDRLGRNGVNLLSVVVPQEKNDRSPCIQIRRSIRAALAHAAQQERLDRPEYQDGLAAYGLWATMCERWAMIIDSGRIERIGSEIPIFARYTAEHAYSARCYARDYLERLATEFPSLGPAAVHYRKVATLLAAVSRFFATDNPHFEAPELREVVEIIRAAAMAERRGIAELQRSQADRMS